MLKFNPSDIMSRRHVQVCLRFQLGFLGLCSSPSELPCEFVKVVVEFALSFIVDGESFLFSKPSGININ